MSKPRSLKRGISELLDDIIVETLIQYPSLAKLEDPDSNPPIGRELKYQRKEDSSLIPFVYGNTNEYLSTSNRRLATDSFSQDESFSRSPVPNNGLSSTVNTSGELDLFIASESANDYVMSFYRVNDKSQATDDGPNVAEKYIEHSNFLQAVNVFMSEFVDNSMLPLSDMTENQHEMFSEYLNDISNNTASGTPSQVTHTSYNNTHPSFQSLEDNKLNGFRMSDMAVKQEPVSCSSSDENDDDYTEESDDIQKNIGADSTTPSESIDDCNTPSAKIDLNSIFSQPNINPNQITLLATPVRLNASTEYIPLDPHSLERPTHIMIQPLYVSALESLDMNKELSEVKMNDVKGKPIFVEILPTKGSRRRSRPSETKHKFLKPPPAILNQIKYDIFCQWEDCNRSVEKMQSTSYISNILERFRSFTGIPKLGVSGNINYYITRFTENLDPLTTSSKHEIDDMVSKGITSASIIARKLSQPRHPDMVKNYMRSKSYNVMNTGPRSKKIEVDIEGFFLKYVPPTASGVERLIRETLEGLLQMNLPLAEEYAVLYQALKDKSYQDSGHN